MVIIHDMGLFASVLCDLSISTAEIKNKEEKNKIHNNYLKGFGNDLTKYG